MKRIFLFCHLALIVSSCNGPQKVEIVNKTNQTIRVTLFKKGVFITSIPYDSSFLENNLECRMTKVGAGESLSLYRGLAGDSTFNINKLNFEKIQIESSQGHITATRVMIPSLFCKHKQEYILEIKQ